MSNPVRILIVILCALALWYLVVALARGVSEGETGSLGEAGSASIASNVAPPSSAG